MQDQNSGRDAVIARLRRALALARFYIDRFADPTSFVWNTADNLPHEFAREAAREIDSEQGATEPSGAGADGPFPAGTARMPRLLGGRAGFVEFHQLLARQALDVGEIGAARAALRVLRTTDFRANGQDAEALLAVLRDSRSTPDEIADAARRLTYLAPMPRPE